MTDWSNGPAEDDDNSVIWCSAGNRSRARNFARRHRRCHRPLGLGKRAFAQPGSKVRSWPIRADQTLRLVTAKLSSRGSPQPEPLGAGQLPAYARERFSAALAGRTMLVGHLEPTSCRDPPSATRRLVLASTMRRRQFSAAFRSLACQSRTSVPTRSRTSTLPATQVVRKRAQLALGATHMGGSPPTSARGRNSKPDATFHPARWAAQAAKPISRDPPRLPRDRHWP